jgi:hypothetical protein
MRVSSLSDDRVITAISRYFVPVWISRDRHQQGEASREEKLLLGKIDLDRRKKKLEGGAVAVYVVTGDGGALATMRVHKAWKPEALAAFLRKVAADEKLTVRKEEDVKASKAPAPPAPRAKGAGGRVFTSRVRFDDGGDNRGVGRDTIELTKAEVAALLPAKLEAGKAHAVPRATAAKLLGHVFPPLPHWSDKQAKLTECSLSVRVVSAGKDGARLRLEGKVAVTYPYQKKDTDGHVKARLVGTATTDADGALSSLALVADKGTYVSYWKGKSRTRAIGVAIELDK